jgi:uncharacterized protein YkwD
MGRQDSLKITLCVADITLGPNNLESAPVLVRSCYDLVTAGLPSSHSIAGAIGVEPVKNSPLQRLNALGMTAALTVVGGGFILGRCAPAPTPAPAPAPAPVGAPPLTSITIAPEVVAIVNAYRAQNGLAPLVENALLNAAAVDHSLYQATIAKMTHTGSGGTNPGQRIAGWGYSARMWAENVAAGQPTSDAVMTAWMNSAGHRANILNPNLREIGVAAVTSVRGTIYWTMDFAA